MKTPRLIPTLLALALAAGACSGSRPELSPDTNQDPSTSAESPVVTTSTAGSEDPGPAVTTGTSSALSTTIPTTTATPAPTVTRPPPPRSSYPEISPLPTVPPIEYPTTG